MLGYLNTHYDTGSGLSTHHKYRLKQETHCITSWHLIKSLQ
jgi:hypothetical protein